MARSKVSRVASQQYMGGIHYLIVVAFIVFSKSLNARALQLYMQKFDFSHMRLDTGFRYDGLLSKESTYETTRALTVDVTAL